MKSKNKLNGKRHVACQYCGMRGSNNSMVHKKCVLEYVKKVMLYEVYQFKSPYQILQEALED